jgi:anti-sigma regulatory factor (Ser/Thr protein kinase)
MLTMPEGSVAVCWQSGRGFVPSAQTPAAGRQFIAATLDHVLGESARRLRDDCELIASELLTNAVQAAASELTLTMLVHHDRVRLTVCDDGGGVPVPRHAHEWETSGRGLEIVSALADDWGVERSGPSSTCVWAELSVPADLTVALSCELRGVR